MRRLDLTRTKVDAGAFRGSFADARHVSRIVAEPCVVYLEGDDRPAAIYLELDYRLPQAVAALRSVRFARSARTDGMVTNARTFGYQPKKTVRGEDACRAAKLATEAPAAHATIAALAEVVEDAYEELNPATYADHERIVAEVLPDWRLSGGVFTSGIINSNSQLPYHYDAGNFAECWSNMLVFKHACVGGDLVCPEIDLCFRLRDHSLLMFDGQAILHGVSPFRLSRPDGYRYSVVFYSLQQMWRCEAAADTVKISARRRTERERARFATS